MKVAMLTAEEANTRSAEVLGLGSDTADVCSVVGLCASLRRAASFLCPASPRQLVDAVLDAAAPIAPDALSRDDLMDRLNELVAVGDLIEFRNEAEHQARQVYLGPPSYVARSPGRYLLLGVRPFGTPLVTDHLAGHIVYEGHLKTIVLDERGAAATLEVAGLHELKPEEWVGAPRIQAAEKLLDTCRQRLANAGPAGAVEGLTVIDPAARVNYYRGRWRSPSTSDSGDFVGRRPQAYGVDRWCFVRIRGGQPQALVDLPVDDLTTPGRFEAWRIQAALDAEDGHPQVLRLRHTPPDIGDRIVDLFSPVPGWAERYLTLVGGPARPERAALLSYQLPNDAVAEACSFLRSRLWMKVVEEMDQQ